MHQRNFIPVIQSIVRFVCDFQIIAHKKQSQIDSSLEVCFFQDLDLVAAIQTVQESSKSEQSLRFFGRLKFWGLVRDWTSWSSWRSWKSAEICDEKCDHTGNANREALGAQAEACSREQIL